MHEIDFNKTFFLIIRQELLCIFLAIAYLFGLIIKQINIIGIYLENLLSKKKLSIFMKLPLNMETFRFI